jgi:hypothetical protein
MTHSQCQTHTSYVFEDAMEKLHTTYSIKILLRVMESLWCFRRNVILNALHRGRETIIEKTGCRVLADAI